MEGYSNPTVLNGSAGNSAPVGGRRKLKLVTKKAARKALKKLGMKLRGGAEAAPVVADAAEYVSAYRIITIPEPPEAPGPSS